MCGGGGGGVAGGRGAGDPEGVNYITKMVGKSGGEGGGEGVFYSKNHDFIYKKTPFPMAENPVRKQPFPLDSILF